MRRFLIRRFFRLFPAYWLSIPLGYLLLWLPWGRSFSVGDVLANATMLPAVFGAEATIGLYWTLEAELAFYTLCVGLFAIGVLRERTALLAMVGLLVAVMLLFQLRLLHSPELAQWKLLPYNLSLMFAGSLVRQAHDAYRSGNADPKALRVAIFYALFAVGVTTVPAMGSLVFGRNVESKLFAYAYLIGIAIFVTTVVVWSRPHRAIVWLGTISYSLYLLHPIVLYAMVWLLTYVWHVPAPFGAGTLLLLLAAGSIAFASLTYVAVELPAINHARRLTGGEG
jgi:peptidoglycan/LPS O-acetylase OafA/YrhL